MIGRGGTLYDTRFFFNGGDWRKLYLEWSEKDLAPIKQVVYHKGFFYFLGKELRSLEEENALDFNSSSSSGLEGRLQREDLPELSLITAGYIYILALTKTGLIYLKDLTAVKYRFDHEWYLLPTPTPVSEVIITTSNSTSIDYAQIHYLSKEGRHYCGKITEPSLPRVRVEWSEVE